MEDWLMQCGGSRSALIPPLLLDELACLQNLLSTPEDAIRALAAAGTVRSWPLVSPALSSRCAAVEALASWVLLVDELRKHHASHQGAPCPDACRASASTEDKGKRKKRPRSDDVANPPTSEGAGDDAAGVGATGEAQDLAALSEYSHRVEVALSSLTVSGAVAVDVLDQLLAPLVAKLGDLCTSPFVGETKPTPAVKRRPTTVPPEHRACCLAHRQVVWDLLGSCEELGLHCVAPLLPPDSSVGDWEGKGRREDSRVPPTSQSGAIPVASLCTSAQLRELVAAPSTSHSPQSMVQLVVRDANLPRWMIRKHRSVDGSPAPSKAAVAPQATPSGEYTQPAQLLAPRTPSPRRKLVRDKGPSGAFSVPPSPLRLEGVGR